MYTLTDKHIIVESSCSFWGSDGLLLFFSGDEGKTQHAANTGKRIYTALPPPADYNRDSEKSVIFPQRENINSAEAPAGKTAIILHLWTGAVHHKAREDLHHEDSQGWRFLVLK